MTSTNILWLGQPLLTLHTLRVKLESVSYPAHSERCERWIYTDDLNSCQSSMDVLAFAILLKIGCSEDPAPYQSSKQQNGVASFGWRCSISRSYLEIRCDSFASSNGYEVSCPLRQPSRKSESCISSLASIQSMIIARVRRLYVVARWRGL